jgi:hypothetical protein
LTANYGIYYDNLNKVFLRDSVMVINKDGDTLRTPELWWDQNMQKFYTDKPARLDGKDKHLTGTQGLEATQDLRSIQFKYPRAFRYKRRNNRKFFKSERSFLQIISSLTRNCS